MWVKHLELSDFRSYQHASLELPPGPSVLIGRNGQGKTNLVESIGYLATLSSHRVAQDVALIRQGCDRALIRARVATGADREVTVEIEINRGTANRGRINRSAVARMRDILGTVRSVVFAPEDLRLVRGDPGDRRRFLDDLMVQVAPRYLGLRSEYEKVVRQRNALLRSLGGRLDAAAEASLAPWDEQLVLVGSELLLGRLNAVRRLVEPVRDSYARISDSETVARIDYRTSIGDVEGLGDLAAVRAAMSAAMVERRREEVARSVTLIGPHRDDLVLSLGDLPAKGYASHGESWSICLALRLGSYQVMTGIADDPPVLVLDDVFAELDTGRRRALAEEVGGANQVLVTAAVAEDVPEELGGTRFVVTRSTGFSSVLAETT